MSKDKAGFLENVATETSNKEEEGITQIDEITPEEIELGLRSIKNRKTPGPANLHIELLKAALFVVLDITANICKKCLDGDEPPWRRQDFITPIYKKGNLLSSKTFR